MRLTCGSGTLTEDSKFSPRCLTEPLFTLLVPASSRRISQIYAIRQAIAKSVVAFYQKYVDETSKNEIKV